MSYRRGPQLAKTFVWSAEKSAWVEQAAAEDGFSAIVGESGFAKDRIKRIADVNPLAAERVLLTKRPAAVRAPTSEARRECW
jgi:hypothetical protein